MLYRVQIDDAGQTSLGGFSGRPDPNLCARAEVLHWLLRAATVAAPPLLLMAIRMALTRWFPGCEDWQSKRRVAAVVSTAITTVAVVVAMAWLLPKMVYYRYVIPLGDERAMSGLGTSERVNYG